MTETIFQTADIQRIMQLLPHRYPFLLIDKVIKINGDETGVGIKNVTANEPQFMGHFPEQPVFPGVLMIEGMAQTAGILAIGSLNMDAPKLVYFMTIDGVKFRKPVGPGDQIEYHLTKTNKKRNIWFYRGEAYVNGALVAEANLSAMMVDKK